VLQMSGLEVVHKKKMMDDDEDDDVDPNRTVGESAGRKYGGGTYQSGHRRRRRGWGARWLRGGRRPWWHRGWPPPGCAGRAPRGVPS
jgi:hypothetical protein